MNAVSYLLYKSTSPSGKVYIGMTKKTLEQSKNRKRGEEGNRKAALSMGGKPFICVETGEKFYTLREAADRFNIPCKYSIYKVLKGKRKTYKTTF